MASASMVLERTRFSRHEDTANTAMNKNSIKTRRRTGAALMMAMFVMAVASMLVVTILDTQTLQFASLRNTMDYDRARYLAEAGVGHALAILERDFENQPLRDDGIATRQFPPGSGNTYSATVEYEDDKSDEDYGTMLITARGDAGQFTRWLQITVKMGG